MKMSVKRNIIKGVATGVVSAGISAVVKDVIDQNTTVPDGRWNGWKYKIGTMAIVGLITAASDNQIGGKLDSFFTKWDEFMGNETEDANAAAESTGEQPQADATSASS